jgi:PIN domain nuclease of toxin-antitoxin system
VKVLVDTHALLWLQSNDPRLSKTALARLADPATVRHLSMASVWEIAIKSGIKKLTLSEPFDILLPRVISTYSLNLLPITIGDCAAYERFAFPDPNHRDPFDRMLVVHLHQHGLELVSADVAFDAYGMSRIW